MFCELNLFACELKKHNAVFILKGLLVNGKCADRMQENHFVRVAAQIKRQLFQ